MVGFTDKDSHIDVLSRASKALGLRCNRAELMLLCSGGIVPDTQINNKPWTLGEYLQLNGGNQNRSKRVWGICIPIGLEEDEAGPSPFTQDSVKLIN